MPPFGSEPSEKHTKPTKFLSLSAGHKKASSNRPARPSKVFGGEGAERVPEGRGTSSAAPSATPAKGSATTAPFQDELDESFGPQNKIRKTSKPAVLPFQDEAAEGQPGPQSSSDDGDVSDSAYESKSTSVFSLGWQSMVALKKAGFWKDNKDDVKAKPKKRAYDNSKRKQEALYLDKDRTGVFRKRGSDEERLKDIFREPTCRCAMTSITRLLLRIKYFSCKEHDTGCETNYVTLIVFS